MFMDLKCHLCSNCSHRLTKSIFPNRANTIVFGVRSRCAIVNYISAKLLQKRSVKLRYMHQKYEAEKASLRGPNMGSITTLPMP